MSPPGCVRMERRAEMHTWGRRRTGCARRPQTAFGQAGKVLHRAGEALRRVDELLQATREDVSGALRAGQEAIRGTRS
jgi:hypothetical protein